MYTDHLACSEQSETTIYGAIAYMQYVHAYVINMITRHQTGQKVIARLTWIRLIDIIDSDPNIIA